MTVAFLLNLIAAIILGVVIGWQAIEIIRLRRMTVSLKETSASLRRKSETLNGIIQIFAGYHICTACVGKDPRECIYNPAIVVDNKLYMDSIFAKVKQRIHAEDEDNAV